MYRLGEEVTAIGVHGKEQTVYFQLKLCNQNNGSFLFCYDFSNQQTEY